jgi:hypothetical protein
MAEERSQKCRCASSEIRPVQQLSRGGPIKAGASMNKAWIGKLTLVKKMNISVILQHNQSFP